MTNGHQIPDKSEEEILYQYSGLDKYNPPVEIHLVRETNKSMKDLFKVLPGETLEDKPDLVRVNAQQLRKLINAGLIQDLSTFYEEYATPFTKEIMRYSKRGPLNE